MDNYKLGADWIDDVARACGVKTLDYIPDKIVESIGSLLADLEEVRGRAVVVIEAAEDIMWHDILYSDRDALMEAVAALSDSLPSDPNGGDEEQRTP